jgi:proteasome accessory factor C
VTTPGVGYAPSKDDVTCVIDLGVEARWVLDYYPVEIVKESSKGTRIRFHSPDAEVPARLLLRLGSHARLVDGAEVAVRIGEIGAELLSKYQ